MGLLDRLRPAGRTMPWPTTPGSWSGSATPGAATQRNRHNVGQMVARRARRAASAPRSSAHKAHVARRRGLASARRPEARARQAERLHERRRAVRSPALAEVLLAAGRPRSSSCTTSSTSRSTPCASSSGGGHGGHNGVRDVAKALDAGDFTRVRVGIGRPPGRQDAADFVLKDFSAHRAPGAAEPAVGCRGRRRGSSSTHGLVAAQQRIPLARLSRGRARADRSDQAAQELLGREPSARARCTRRSSSSVESSTVSGCHASTGSPSTKSARRRCRVECGIRTLDRRPPTASSTLDDRVDASTSSDSSSAPVATDGCAVARPAGTGGHRGRRGDRPRRRRAPGCRRASFELVARRALHPLEPVPAAREHLVEALQQLDVHHRLAVGLAPALALPPGHPLGDRVDHVLAVAEHVQLVVEVRGRAEELEHGGQLGLVVGGVRPAARRPARVVDVPGPARGAGVSESRSVGGGDDHGVPSSEVRPHRIGRPRHRAARPSACPVRAARLAGASAQSGRRPPRRGPRVDSSGDPAGLEHGALARLHDRRRARRGPAERRLLARRRPRRAAARRAARSAAPRRACRPRSS